ncbi:uncharacterized protein YbaP (TraB family) [Paenibacillus turicensis]|uniref:Uncharacterized protein YbaP (TraB family) n=1 Tax=Paenibacillus turicensis TaxID=160487 RepID=A0ABS4FPL9_9BACL|nr:TraB/GumN family protein [Paenibacillus turicensis]MBP1904534.1 uncharacterized protein YbaP (TraB family) [Paenibacillus turicensis]
MKFGIKIQLEKLTVLFLSFILLFVLSTGGAPAQAAASSVYLALGDKEIAFDQGQPYIEQATTMVPAKVLLEGLDYELSWDAATSTLHASKGKLSFELKRGQKQAMANGEGYVLNVAPKIVDGILYAPLRFLAENAGYRVGWDAANRAVYLERMDSKGFFWKVEKDGSELYLLGSIHVGNDLLHPMRPEINAAFAKSNNLVVEINMDAPLNEQELEKIKNLKNYPVNTNLANHIDADTYVKLQQIFKENGIPESEYGSSKAWWIYIQLYGLKMISDGYETGLSIDNYFLQKAKVNDKSVLELESHYSQYAMLSNFSDELAASLLKQRVESFYQPDNDIKPMIDAWVNGDDKFLVEDLVKMMAVPEYYKGVIQDRNVGMIDKIVGYLEDGSKNTYFIVVGASHMLGQDGIVTKLKEKGYTVTRL